MQPKPPHRPNILFRAARWSLEFLRSPPGLLLILALLGAQAFLAHPWRERWRPIQERVTEARADTLYLHGMYALDGTGQVFEDPLSISGHLAGALPIYALRTPDGLRFMRAADGAASGKRVRPVWTVVEHLHQEHLHNRDYALIRSDETDSRRPSAPDAAHRGVNLWKSDVAVISARFHVLSVGAWAPTEHWTIADICASDAAGAALTNDEIAQARELLLSYLGRVDHPDARLMLAALRAPSETLVTTRRVSVAFNATSCVLVALLVPCLSGVPSWGAWYARLTFEQNRRVRAGKCPRCKYDRSHAWDGPCTECGHRLGEPLH